MQYKTKDRTTTPIIFDAQGVIRPSTKNGHLATRGITTQLLNHKKDEDIKELDNSYKFRNDICNFRISLIKRQKTFSDVTRQFESSKEHDSASGFLDKSLITSKCILRAEESPSAYRHASKKASFYVPNHPSRNFSIHRTDMTRVKTLSSCMRSASKKQEHMQDIIKIQKLKKQMRRNVDMDSDFASSCYSTNPNRFLQRHFRLNPRFLCARRSHSSAAAQSHSQLFSQHVQHPRKPRRSYYAAMRFYRQYKCPVRKVEAESKEVERRKEAKSVVAVVAFG